MNNLLPLTGCGLMIVSLGYVITFWFRTIFAFDKLIKYQYENLHQQWEKDRQPYGMFWKPELEKIGMFNRVFFGSPAISSFRFIFTTPEWVKNDPESMSNIKKFRKFLLLWNVGVVVWFLVIFPSILIIFTPK
jgi:hypothetical protein